MEQYLITPWDTRVGSEPAPVDWDMQVPPEVDTIAEQVMRQYDMNVSSRTLITSKPDKGGAIWRIETDKGPRSLKLLHRNPERSLFSIGLQEYVVQQGARVPALIPAKDGKRFVEMGGKLWIVTDWISLIPATKVDLVGAQELCYGLGEFHRYTKGYMPPLGAKNSSRLYRWPNYYQKVAKKIGWMREMAKAYRDTAASASILSVVDHYERQAIEALERLKASAYPRMVARGEPHWGLVHQDYGWSNGQNGPGGLWVIDLDGVSYDLPFRDLRKLITSTMDDMGVWDLTWMRGMIDAYHAANPLDAESYEVLLIDMAVPNEFYKHLKEMFFDPVAFLNTEAEAILQRVVATDQSKAQALAELAAEKAKYTAGDYEQNTVAAAPERVPSEKAWDQSSWGLQPQPQPQPQPERVAVAADVAKKTEKIKVKKRLAPAESDRAVEKEEASRASSKSTGKKAADKKVADKKAAEKAADKKAADKKPVDKKPVDKRTADKKASEEKAKSREKEASAEGKPVKLVKSDPKRDLKKNPKSDPKRDPKPLGAERAVSEPRNKGTHGSAEKQPARTRKVPASKVIDLLPYLADSEKQTKRSKKSAASAAPVQRKRKAETKPKLSAQPKKSSAALGKALSKAVPKRKAKAVKPIGKQKANQVAKSRQRSVSAGNHTKKAAQPKAKHSYAKVPAPSRKLNKQAGQKPRAKKGIKTIP